MIRKGIQRFLTGVIIGFGLLARDLHGVLHRRWGDRVYAAYAIVGLCFLLVVTGAIWKLIEALLTLVVVVVIIVFAIKFLISPISGGKGGR